MSNWMTLNQSALDGQNLPQNSGGSGVTNQYITIINNYDDDDGEVYDWEPIKE
jgi:hypothetical protein